MGRKVLLLFWCLIRGKSKGKEFAFVQCMRCVPPLQKSDEALGYLCLKCATAGSAKKGLDREKKGENRDAVAAGKCFGAIPFQSTASTMHVVRARTAVRPFTTELS